MGRLLFFLHPYRRLAILALIMLACLVSMDLAIPRLIQHVIDQGIARHDRTVILHSALLMLGISALSSLLAIANNSFSVRVGEGVARDLRQALFHKIQQYSFANLDQQKTGELLVRLTSDVAAVKQSASLLRLMQGRTSFVIAHRLSTIRDADQVLVIEAGHVVESGTHQQLLQAGGLYHHLYTCQFKGQTL